MTDADNLRPHEDETEGESNKALARAFSIFDPENAVLYTKLSEELVTLNRDPIPPNDEQTAPNVPPSACSEE